MTLTPNTIPASGPSAAPFAVDGGPTATLPLLNVFKVFEVKEKYSAFPKDPEWRGTADRV